MKEGITVFVNFLMLAGDNICRYYYTSRTKRRQIFSCNDMYLMQVLVENKAYRKSHLRYLNPCGTTTCLINVVSLTDWLNSSYFITEQ